ncbi:hypothetical protein ACN47A_31990 [Myxococcus fulvus]|uniref:hypothetical protein n=1 Tax=Myxococcus fulvus TaxID=33 RepID=UPI003B99EFFE
MHWAPLARLGMMVLFAVSMSAWASSSAGPIPPEDIVRQGTSVVVGRFLEGASVHWRELGGQFDERGRPVTVREVYTLRDFEVLEVVDGAPPPARLRILTVGGTVDGMSTPESFTAPPPGVAVGLALLPVEGQGETFIIVHVRSFEVDSPAKLASFRGFVREARKPVPESPEDARARDVERQQPQAPDPALQVTDEAPGQEMPEEVPVEEVGPETRAAPDETRGAPGGAPPRGALPLAQDKASPERRGDEAPLSPAEAATKAVEDSDTSVIHVGWVGSLFAIVVAVAIVARVSFRRRD